MRKNTAVLIIDMARRSGLEELDIENLALGRITRNAMRHARSRIAEACADYDAYLSEELNDLIEAAKMVEPFGAIK